MRILYAATDQVVPGSLGGAVHVQAVAEGLATLGHDVHVAARVAVPAPASRATWHTMSLPFASARLRLLCAGALTRLAREIRPDVVIERYHNFGGEGALAARRMRVPLVLEVNAPVVDYPGSAKQIVDRALIVEPMRRWREWQCRRAALFVTPMARILPAWVPPGRILEIEWGGDTDRFRPDVTGPLPFHLRAGQTTVVFAGAFRPWHGAVQAVRAMRTLRDRGRTEFTAVMIGEGPELLRAKAEAEGLSNVQFVGAVPHDRMPACLAAADIGVAPFEIGAHRPLQLGFYWSPLKVFEYMAAGLPVVAPDIDRLRHIVRHGREGLLYDPARPDGLADALAKLDDPDQRRSLGLAARNRVEADFSWAVHCRQLERAIRRVVDEARQAACGS